MKRLLLLSALLLLLSSCASIKPYETQYLNDAEMGMQLDPTEQFGLYVFSIREGAKPPGSSKGSGGCGCN